MNIYKRYDKELIGTRLLELRNSTKPKTSVLSIAKELYYALTPNTGGKNCEETGIQSYRTKYYKWEKPTGHKDKLYPAYDELFVLCNFYHCDMEYFFSKEMTCKTKEYTDINKVTGLTETSIQNIKALKVTYLFGPYSNELNKFLSNNNFSQFLKQITEYNKIPKTQDAKDTKDAKAFRLYKDFIDMIEQT